MKIGIIGQGFVGTAIREGLRSYYDVQGYDIQDERCFNLEDVGHVNERLSTLVLQNDVIFVCLPTPMRKDLSCDTRIVESALEEAYAIIKKNDPDPVHSDFLNRQKNKKIFVIKSTVPPGTTERWAAKYPRIAICFSPEFLTEANSIDDFKNQSRIIIGGEGARILKQVFRKVFPRVPIVITKSSTAEMVKYFTNCFLATKVTFANQMYKICEASDIDYDKVCEYALYDNRIGKSHLAVPGPDGDTGFGGHCFPKDLAAMIHFADEVKAGSGLLQAVDFYNKNIRKNKDWESMKGRAVADD